MIDEEGHCSHNSGNDHLGALDEDDAHFSPVDLGDQQGDVISHPQQGRDDVALGDVAGPETSDVNDSNSPRQCIEAPEHGSGSEQFGKAHPHCCDGGLQGVNVIEKSKSSHSLWK